MHGVPSHIILIPGLLEPYFAFSALHHSLAKRAERVTLWRDRPAFRDLENSINRLSETIAGDAIADDAIAGDANRLGQIGLVTHSFGDWVARAALARSTRHRVTAMVSLAPVMRAGFLPSLLYGVTGNLIPEIKVIMNRDMASANLDCDPCVDRLVIWSRFDESLRQVPLEHIANLSVQKVWATHLSIPWQPNSMRLVSDFLFTERRERGQG